MFRLFNPLQIERETQITANLALHLSPCAFSSLHTFHPPPPLHIRRLTLSSRFIRVHTLLCYCVTITIIIVHNDNLHCQFWKRSCFFPYIYYDLRQ